jgi:outer membrane protein OmpA-like peptidoglycan-associated protein
MSKNLSLAVAAGLLMSWCSPGPAWAEGGNNNGEVNLLSWGAGVLIVQAPASYGGGWTAAALLDEAPGTGWATPSGDLAPKVFVFELADKSEVTRLVFDTAQVETAGRGAKNLLVEISDRKDGGFVEIARPSLAAKQDGQKFPLKAPAVGRYLKLTVLNNWGDDKYMEIMNMFAFGKPLVKRALANASGAYSSSYSTFRLQQTGASASGCYEYKSGLIENGGFDGRVLHFTWTEVEGTNPRRGGPAILIFSDDGQAFTGYWWRGADAAPSGEWVGKRVSKEVGACPHWKPGTDDVVQQIKNEGRARLYGIMFDTDSDHLKGESRPALDALLAAARNQPSWSFGIEGYTDNTGSAAHNQALSESRALAVKTYLIAAGVDAKRLTTQGFGANQPVSSNDTELGRSQNRRVEIVRKGT